jgi:hypothetical protein
MGRELGCKTTGCMLGMLVVFLFFWGMFSVTEREAKKLKALAQRRAAEDAKSDLPLLYVTVQRYAQENGGMLPPMSSPEAFKAALVPRYLDIDDVLKNKRDKSLYLPNAALDGRRVAGLPAPGAVALLGEASESPQSHKRWAMFADGTLREVDAAEWSAATKPLPPIGKGGAAKPSPAPAASPAGKPAAGMPLG